MFAFIWFLFAILGLIIIFLCICLVVDGHLVPAVEVIIEEFSLPEEIAAVTLIAFGSSTPEIVLNTISAIDKASSLSMPALLGSAMIAFGFIPAICVIYNQKTEILIETGPIIRETFFYIVGLFLFMNIIHDGVSTTKESIAMISLYIFYVAFVVGRYLFNKKEEEEKVHTNHSDTKPNESNDDQNLSLNLQSQQPHDLIYYFNHFFEYLSKPLAFFFKITIPAIRTQAILDDKINLSNIENQDTENQVNKQSSEQLESKLNTRLHVCNPKRYLSCILRRQNNDNLTIESNSQCIPITIGSNHIIGLFQASLCRALCCIIVCIFYIAIFASLIVQTSSVIVNHVGLSQTTVGATLVSLGTEIPDLISSIVLSRDGYYGAAFAGATGSQVINITLGAGLPALMMCIYGNGKFYVDDQATSLNLLVVLVMVIILGYLWLTTPLNIITRYFGYSYQAESVVTRLGAFHQLFLFLVTYLMYIVFNE